MKHPIHTLMHCVLLRICYSWLNQKTVSQIFLSSRFLDHLRSTSLIQKQTNYINFLVSMINRLTSGCTKGLTILVITTTFTHIVHLMCTAVGLAQLAKPCSTCFLRNSIRRDSFRFAAVRLLCESRGSNINIPWKLYGIRHPQ